MPGNKKLTPAEVYARLTRQVAYLSKGAWGTRLAFPICTLAFFLSVYTGELGTALLMLFTAMVMLIFEVLQYEHKLLLKLLPKPEGNSTVAGPPSPQEPHRDD